MDAFALGPDGRPASAAVTTATAAEPAARPTPTASSHQVRSAQPARPPRTDRGPRAGSWKRAVTATRPTQPATRSPATWRRRTGSLSCCTPTASALPRTPGQSTSRPRPTGARRSSSTVSRVISASTPWRRTARSPHCHGPWTARLRRIERHGGHRRHLSVGRQATHRARRLRSAVLSDPHRVR